jgi:hypothetical protein
MRSRPLFALVPLLALLPLTSQGAEEPAPRALPAMRWGADVGLLSSGLVAADRAWTDSFAAQALSGHVLVGGLTLEGDALALQPLSVASVLGGGGDGGAGASVTLGVRVGYTGERWSVVGGPLLGFAPGARPRLQVLPTLRALRHVGPLTLHAGVFDSHGLIPAHLGVSWKNVGLSYVLPLGARVWGRLPIGPRVGLRLEGFLYRLAGIHSEAFTLGLDVTP